MENKNSKINWTDKEKTHVETNRKLYAGRINPKN